MTAEHLLEAIGLLDDDLIQEADMIPRRKPVNWRSWTSLAACAALVITLGYGAVYIGGDQGANGGSAAGKPMSPEGGGMAITSSEANMSGGDVQSNGDWPEPVEYGLVCLDDDICYIVSDQTVEELPQGCQLLGTLSALAPDAPAPVTNVEDYVGCPIWSLDGSKSVEVYIQLPDGTYAMGYLEAP